MKLSEYKKDYYEYSELASKAVRTLSFAGLAVAWIFKVDTSNTSPSLPDTLLPAVLFFVLALASDLGQYVMGTIIWGLFHRHHEKLRTDIEDDPVLEHAPILAYPIHIAFFAKIVFVSLGYVVLLYFLVKLWR